MSDQNDNPDEGFLQRWSRRKRSDEDARIQKVAEAEPTEPSVVAGRMITEPELLNPEPETNQAACETEPQQTELAGDDTETAPTQSEEDFENIDFDALDFDSDYTRFMKAGVPEMVRRKALRKLWASNPILANIDGLNDYDEDFTDAKLAVANLQTAFKAQHGYMSDEEVAQQERLGREEEYDAEQERLAEEQRLADETGESEDNAEAEVASTDTDTEQTTDAPQSEAVATEDVDDEDEIDDDGDSDWA